MITPVCSKCRQEIRRDDINVANDIAYCRPCNLSYPLSELTQNAEQGLGIDLNRPPAGTWRRVDGPGTVIGASHRSLGAALGTLAIALFWNGIVSVFVAVATASTLNLLHWPVPAWFPAPKMDGNNMGLGMTLFLWLFLTPFIAIGLAMIAAFFSSLAGRTEFHLSPNHATLFSGIGPIGRRRHFEPRQIKTVRLDDRRWRDSDGDARRQTQLVLEMHDGKRIKFGSMLKEERRTFLLAALRQALPR